MNIHSLFSRPMSDALAPRHVDRRPQILDAAEACFARAGFHRTTMQDVARAAGMVPGNLYRYFPSKDAIIVGLVERDRANIAADFAALGDCPDLIEAFRGLGRKHFIESPREKAALALQIWSEAALDPKIAALIATLQEEVRCGIVSVCTRAKESRAVHPDVDPEFVARIVMMLSDGLMRRAALDLSFDREAEVEMVLSVVGTLMSGAVFEKTTCPAGPGLQEGTV